MELDKRIKDISTIQTILRYDVNCIGCKGYFFDEFIQTKDLSKCRYGELIDITTHDDRNDLCFKAEYEEGLVGFYRFFIPEADLKPIEKKYREYKDLDEFFDVTGLEIGDLIKLKFPGNNVAELLIVGGCYNGLFIGIHKYTFKQLFDIVEISISGEWQPFGVIDE
jgi:hypothetical protein